MTTRRELLVFGASVPALAWAGAVRAQLPTKKPRVGFLSPVSSSEAAPFYQIIRQALRDLGWIEGKNISFEYRYAEGKSDRLSDLVADLVRANVDVIFTGGYSNAALAARKATSTIPIVVAGLDAVEVGLSESLAHPGGNVTGLSAMTLEVGGKRLELLKEIVPKASRVGVFWNPLGSGSQIMFKGIQFPAQQLGIQLHSIEVRSASDFDKAFEGATKARTSALFIVSEPVISANQRRIAELAIKSRLPSISPRVDFADAGGLMAYGADIADIYRRAATYMDKILKGAKPGDLPIEQPTKFELAINLKTANTLGITIPPSVMVRATKVIE